jgi:hypothetical protein
VPPAPTPSTIRRSPLPTRSAYRTAILTALAIVIAWIAILNRTDTIIVSPINPWFVATIVLLCGLAGRRIGATIGAVQAAVSRRPTRRRTIRFLFAATGLAWGMIIGTTVADRLVETLLFWRSPSPIVPTVFPVRSVRLQRGNFYLSVGSEGRTDRIPISKRDYDVLAAATPLGRPWRYCIRLQRQANHDAVRIWLPGARRSGPQTVLPCPAAAQWW